MVLLMELDDKEINNFSNLMERNIMSSKFRVEPLVSLVIGTMNDFQRHFVLVPLTPDSKSPGGERNKERDGESVCVQARSEKLYSKLQLKKYAH